MSIAFVDSDVIISSLLSNKGASSFLFNQTNIDFCISSLSIKELKIVVKRLGIENHKLDKLIEKRLKIVSLNETKREIEKKYRNYVLDQNDAHIVAGAHTAKVRFLISYNLKHFRKEKIKEDFNLILLTPANFLQYLRSQ